MKQRPLLAGRSPCEQRATHEGPHMHLKSSCRFLQHCTKLLLMRVHADSATVWIPVPTLASVHSIFAIVLARQNMLRNCGVRVAHMTWSPASGVPGWCW